MAKKQTKSDPLKRVQAALAELGTSRAVGLSCERSNRTALQWKVRMEMHGAAMTAANALEDVLPLTASAADALPLRRCIDELRERVYRLMMGSRDHYAKFETVADATRIIADMVTRGSAKKGDDANRQPPRMPPVDEFDREIIDLLRRKRERMKPAEIRSTLRVTIEESALRKRLRKLAGPELRKICRDGRGSYWHPKAAGDVTI